MAKITKSSKPGTKKPATKKPAAKKPAVKKAAPAKKPGAKKPAVKKPALAKKPAVKKPAAKKPAAKKAAVKKPAPAKKTAVKKAAPAKKPAAKAPAKKPSAKAPAVKTAVKPAGAAPVKKALPKTPAVKTVKPSVPAFIFPKLFDAYNTNTLPHDQGLIITSAFRDNSAYTIYEVTAYSGVKEISRNDSELRFVCENAKKFYVLVEPFDYFFKYIMDPADRSESDSIPYRKHELEVFTTVNETQIMVAKATRDTAPEFTVAKPHTGDLAAVFTKTPDIFKTIAAFFKETLIRDLNIPQVEAEKASQIIVGELEKAV